MIELAYRYDYPDPGSEVDYIVDKRVDYIKYYDGVSVIQFKKKTINSMDFVSFTGTIIRNLASIKYIH